MKLAWFVFFELRHRHTPLDPSSVDVCNSGKKPLTIVAKSSVWDEFRVLDPSLWGIHIFLKQLLYKQSCSRGKTWPQQKQIKGFWNIQDRALYDNNQWLKAVNHSHKELHLRRFTGYGSPSAFNNILSTFDVFAVPHQLIFELQIRRIKILLSIFTITELTRTYGFGMRIGTWCSPVLNTYICEMVCTAAALGMSYSPTRIYTWMYLSSLNL